MRSEYTVVTADGHRHLVIDETHTVTTEELRQFTVLKAVYELPASVVGQDDQGRTLVVCPQCSGAAHVEPDGRVVCEDWAPIQGYFTAALDRLLAET